MTAIGLTCGFILLSSGCDESGAPNDAQPATTTTVQEVGTTFVADEGCTFAAPFALDAWAAVADARGVVVEAQLLAADPPERRTTTYGEYVTQRLNLDDVDTIFSARGVPVDPREIVVLVRPADPSHDPLSLDANDLVPGAEVIINAYTDADYGTFVKSAAVIDADGSVHFLGYCAEGSEETLATMMEELPGTDNRSERDVVVDWLRARYADAN